ncbi:GPI transamidase component Tta1 [Trypanosoma rangeli]|uniref:GPI transamidase component Tta1 n=1 Tax=Trypanosoma rangeli TaxID=5698 RepID=A0A3S5IR84_TRYRA|nr:GPI transamidase component Tta1 [Trypanosoma rangeli]RNF05085.1 GPI transamidase component Tta1 [Trypanosoma rangeli]|eukprot:RNF05085.1 GPI transamidase component Tta1 [Trypanosoma rangeli]
MQGTTPAKSTERRSGEGRKSTKGEGDWRLRVDTPWAAACIAILLVALGLHYKALCEDRTELLLPELINSMETQCCSLGDVFERPATEPLLHPVPSQFGVAVWVEREPWSLPVHDALDRIEEAISRGLDATTAAASGPRGPRLIQRMVRVATKRLGNGSGQGDSASLVLDATTQQLGLGVAKHVCTADLRGEVVMYGISFFRRATSAAGTSHVECLSFDEGRAYCTIPENASSTWLSREVPAAVATLMSRWLKLSSFRDTAEVQRWTLKRKVHSCIYALRALRQLERSVATHPDMPAPLDVAETVHRLQALIEAGDFIQFARAADDLQFHPLLLPQLYIPLDQALVIHFSILLPVAVMTILGVRLTIAARKRRRNAAKKQETPDVKND